MTTATINDTKADRRIKGSVFDNWAKSGLLNRLARLREGCLMIQDGSEQYRFGDLSGRPVISAQINIHHPAAYRDIVFGGSVGAAESFMLGTWSSPNLVSLTRLMALNMDILGQLDRTGAWLKRFANKLYHWLSRNTETQARRNIAAHYDLSNELFSLFLSGDMMYSSAVFPHPNTSLEEASQYKLDLICRKLHLSEQDHLLEIGTGWGGLAIYAAKHYGCRVTTTTISQQQFQYTREQVCNLGLQDRIEVLLQDYRHLKGHYDKLVSIEMMEAVGYEYYDRYFKACSHRLKPNGIMLLQVITIPDQRYQQARRSVDFIKRYIFPGGGLPSHRVITDCVNRCTDLQMLSMQEIGLDYAETLKHWRSRFMTQVDNVKALGFDDIFVRMWHYYLSYCEGGFRERVIGTSQFLFAKPGWRSGIAELPNG